MQSAASFRYRAERIFVLSAALLVGLGLTLLVGRVGNEEPGGGTQVFWLMTIALMVVAGTGAAWLRRSEGRQVGTRATGEASMGHFALPLEVVMPALLTLGYALILQIFENGAVQGVILSLAALSFAAVYWAQTHTVSASDPYAALGQIALNVLAHIAAFMLFSVIYGLKERALVSGTAVGVVSALLVFELLARDNAWRQTLAKQSARPTSRLALLALATGIVLAELTWALNYWAALTTLVGGAFLLAAFYVVYGLLSHYVEGTLDRQTSLEFGAVGAVALLVILGSAFFGGG